MKRVFINIIAMLFVASAMVACHKDSALDNPQPEEWVADGSPVSIKLGVKIPDPIEVATRAVDPDGNGIQTMTLFCFNGEGLLISTATADITPKGDESGGILDADIPNTTRVIHLLANQNMAQFKEDTFRNLSEDQVIANLEGSSGMMIYWARVEIPAKVVGNEAILDWFTKMTDPTEDGGAGYPIMMLRNQAKVMVDAGGTEDAQGRKWNGTNFTVTGFTVVNTQAFGTVAPYHPTYGYPTYACTSTQNTNYTFEPSFGLTTGSTANWRDTNYVNLPRRSDKFSNITDVDTAPQTYVFETENSSADPVSVIIKGKNAGDTNDKYYRVTLTDSNGEQVLVRRNHLYTIHIKGELLYGVDTFAEALDAPATNNVWLSISDEIKSVQNSDFKLTVDQTSVVIDHTQLEELSGQSTPAYIPLTFSVKALGEAEINDNDLQISWVGDQDVSSTYTFVQGDGYTFDTTSGEETIEGTIYVNLNDLADDKNEGTILVKYGHLQRKIKVIVLKQQKFTPTWVTAQVYTSTGSTSSNATLVFTIPQDCPAELFPMNVLISTNELDVRSETGQVLPIIRKGEEGYGVDNRIGYKYVYEVTKPGEQFVYMKSILSQTSGTSTPITIEAEHFESVTKQVVYANHQFAITVTNVQSNSATGNDADKIYYVYLPQKKNAPWAINLKMMNTATDQPQSVGQYDEFLLYSQNLDAYADDEIDEVKPLLPQDDWLGTTENGGLNAGYFPCQFTTINEDLWSTGGRVHAFIPRFQYYSQANETNGYKNHFSIYMKTNKAKSAEIIRISSNQLNSTAAFTTNYVVDPQDATWKDTFVENNDALYLYKDKGTVSTYRSMVFELRNYPAFRFAAQVTGATGVVPTYATDYKDLSDNEEANTPVQIAYVPGTEVAVAFDVTSFIAEDNASVDPFGTAFDIFIQTPGLELAEQNAKITKVDDTGLYKYTVNANRATEAENWDTDALQSSIDGERKVITFKTKEIVTEGDIVIYTDPDQISYKTKTFNVTNAPISGNITCSDGTTVPKGQFVSFSRELDGSRIGSVTVTADGQYQLRLRKEYEFTWNQNDPVKFYAKIGNSYYTATLNNLEALYNNPSITLVKESTVGE
ncbi:MAG: hypothetical protein IJ378_06260 [Alistipes sp.]|nr:hypothetical protein [Alistipes sp.]